MFGVPHLPETPQYPSGPTLQSLSHKKKTPSQPCLSPHAQSSQNLPVQIPLPPGTPPTERYSSCLLCGQRFLKRNIKLLALHLEQQHPQKWNDAVKGLLAEETKDYHYLTPKTLPSYASVPSRSRIYESINTPLQVWNIFVHIN